MMEEKRRLPAWMIGASTTNKLSKPLDTDANRVITNDEMSAVTKSTKPKEKRVTRNHKKDDSLPSDEKSLLVKYETKRKKKGFAEKDVIEHYDSDQEVIVEKRKRGKVKRKIEETDPSRKNKEQNYDFGSCNENQALSCDEDDFDLTMDDILSIAKEFVENDKIEQKPSEVEYELRSKSSYTTSPMHEETDSNHDSVKNTRSKVTLADSKLTGDPAQDMLDLFLGPLLKKPIGKEKTNSINDVIIPHEIKNNQHDAVISNKPVIMTKKKSSLRDTVAMLLD